MGSIQWTETHEHLQTVMKRELETMRQLLANISLEEQFILRKEEKYWSSMMEERSSLIEQLSKIRQNKLGVIDRLEALTQQTDAPLEELLPTQDMNSWEILFLRDQMMTLLDRMNLQRSRNEMLLHLAKAPLGPQQAPQKKAKTTVATLPPENQ